MDAGDPLLARDASASTPRTRRAGMLPEISAVGAMRSSIYRPKRTL